MDIKSKIGDFFIEKDILQGLNFLNLKTLVHLNSCLFFKYRPARLVSYEYFLQNLLYHRG